MGVSRPSIREALRLLEATGWSTPSRTAGPWSPPSAWRKPGKLYAARAVLEGFAGRECARLHDPAVVRKIGEALGRLKLALAESDMIAVLEAKTDFYAALIGGCQNAFIERMLKPLHDRITLLRITSMSHPKRVNKSLREVTAIWRAIQSGDADLAERCCVDHVRAAAVAALDMIERSMAKEKA